MTTKIANFISQGQNKATPRGVAIPGNQQAPPGNLGAGTAIGEGVFALSKNMEQVNSAFDDARMVSELSGAKVGLIRQMAAIESDLNNRQDDENFVSDYDAQIKKLKEDTYKTISYQKVKDTFEPYFTSMTTAGRITTENLARKKFVLRDTGKLMAENSSLLETAAVTNDYNQIMTVVRPAGISAIQGRQAGGVINGVTATKMSAEFDNTLWTNYIEAQTEAHPIALKAALEDMNKFPGLTPAARKTLSDKNDVNYAVAMAEMSGGSYEEQIVAVEKMKDISEDAQNAAVSKLAQNESVRKTVVTAKDKKLTDSWTDPLMQSDIPGLNQLKEQIDKSNAEPKTKLAWNTHVETKINKIMTNQRKDETLSKAERALRISENIELRRQQQTDWAVQIVEKKNVTTDMIITAMHDPDNQMGTTEFLHLKNLIEKGVGQSTADATKYITQLYNGGAFGPTSGKNNEDAKVLSKKTKADLIIALQDFEANNKGKNSFDFIKKLSAQKVRGLTSGAVKKEMLGADWLYPDTKMSYGEAVKAGKAKDWTPDYDELLPSIGDIDPDTVTQFRTALGKNTKKLLQLRKKYFIKDTAAEVTDLDMRALYKEYMDVSQY